MSWCAFSKKKGCKKEESWAVAVAVLMLNGLIITFTNEKHTLLSTIKNIDCRLLDVTETVLIKPLLFGNCSVDAHTNTQIINATIEYILTNERFDESQLHS